MGETYEDLLATYQETETLIMKFPGSQTTADRVNALVPSGIWEHFKSTHEKRMFYGVLGPAQDVDDGLYRVAYMALYPPYSGKLALRQLVGPSPKTGEYDGFLMPVKRDVYAGPRFRLVEACLPGDLFERMQKYSRV